MDERKKIKIKIFYDRTALENANYYFELSKKFSKKAEQAEKAIINLKEKAKKQEKEDKNKMREQTKIVEMPYFYTSKSKLLCIAGRNAEENEKLYRKSTEKDLLFHADIQGGSLVVLKEGINAELEDKLEAAYYAACYSKAWLLNYSSINVYAFKQEQVYKEKQSPGAFNIKGEREWFKNCALMLKIVLLNDNKIFIVPSRWSSDKIIKEIEIRPGNNDKNEVAKKISKILKCEEPYIKALLPQGKFTIKEVKK
jgi:predicted ribosome quality control (RQC) complex YloA/Tae2 family protein